MGTKQGEPFQQALNLDMVKKMRAATLDANYLKHEKAETDAANAFCHALVAGQHFDLWHEGRICETYNFGFNQIPIKAFYLNGKYTSAFISDDTDRNIDAKFIGAENCGRLRHPVLNIAAEESFESSVLSDWQMRQLNSDFSYTSHHNSERALFQKAEIAAALLFQKQMIGETTDNILSRAGNPTSKTRLGKIWGDSSDGSTSWIYFLGYSCTPVRLIIENGKCVDSMFLSGEQCSNFYRWNISQLSQLKFYRIPDEIAPFYNPDLHPVGRSAAFIVNAIGEPSTISKNTEGRTVYVYNFARHAAMNLTFDKDICVSSANSTTIGYRRKEYFF